MPDKILFVDDEENVLSALKRQFRKLYTVSTALGGASALQMLADHGPFAVIVSDMQMPEMNGVQLLQQARKLAPDSVRLMLTGNADQKTAMDAVNEGSVFSFLTKPCPPETMARSIAAAVEQYRLITAERELLEGTLNGSVKLLMDMLSMLAPDSFGRTITVRDMASKMSAVIKLENTWDLNLAAMLFNLASVTLPQETLASLSTGKAMSSEENLMIARLPETGKQLIANIPRLERVADIVYYHQKHFNGLGFPEDSCSGTDIPVESRILKILCDLETLMSQGCSQQDALTRMAAQDGIYDPVLLRTAAKVLGEGVSEGVTTSPVEVMLNGLQPGQVLAANIETTQGQLLFSAGQKITAATVARLHNYHQITKVREPIKVFGEARGNVDLAANG
ncbi:MAG: HD domain-containing phosphohydrolase [Gammaproteobacteria bacterium]|jgi:response regulator RpfG family c-di-GMP phosphodiesterase